MKIRLLLISMACALSPVILSAAEREASTISAFAGAQSGTLTYRSNNTVYVGSTIGLFKTSSTKELGTLTLASLINTGGDPLPVQHSLTFRKRHATYGFYTGSMPILGSGSARVTSSKITYSLNAVSGNTPYTIRGTIRLKKKTVLITEQLFGGGSLLLTLNYKLVRQFR